jgi:FkbM family methyltransferase|tara:strand:- start:6811 stop:7512 length:702 start_codon:yes stop_codon:yes gene_type:complete
MPKLKQFNEKEFNINVGGKKIIFSNNPSSKTYIKNRMDRMLSKEPETINWINGFDKTTVFFDIGANIGIYSLYSAIVKQNLVYAFEPHAASYKNLLESINLNKLQNCNAHCIAMGDKLALGSIDVKNMHEGVANNIVGKKGEFYHGCTEFSLNFLVSKKMLPQPDHIKIDVDGYEDKVIEGSMEVFRNTKSILLEISNKNINYVDMIEALGFKVESKHRRNEEEFNYIFTNAN